MSVFENTYDYVSVYSDFTGYKTQYCKTNTIVCLAGGLTGIDTIHVIACANCLNALTAKNVPAYYGLAWWYLTDTFSLGFSPNSTVKQNTADKFDASNEKKLSWHLTGGPGIRVGSVLVEKSSYTKYVFIKDGINFSFFIILILYDESSYKVIIDDFVLSLL